jgi:adenylate cyclase
LRWRLIPCQAKARHQKFDWHAAELTYRRSLDLNSNQSNVYLWLGLLLEGKGEAEEALKVYEKGCTVNPGWDYLTTNQVRCLVNAGKREQAIALQQKLVEKHVAEPELQVEEYNDLARLYWSAGQKDEAIDAAAMGGLTALVTFFKEGNPAELQRSVDEKYEQMKKNSDYISQLWMGIDYAKAGAREKALDCFNNAIALKDVAVTLLLINHFDFLNIKYLNMALITRKIRMMVNF